MLVHNVKPAETCHTQMQFEVSFDCRRVLNKSGCLFRFSSESQWFAFLAQIVLPVKGWKIERGPHNERLKQTMRTPIASPSKQEAINRTEPEYAFAMLRPDFLRLTFTLARLHPLPQLESDWRVLVGYL